MFKELAKIANKLDGLGLTKEADVLDAFIRKAANDLDGTNYDTETSGPTVTSSNIDLVSENIANNINNENPSISRTNFVTEFIRRFKGSSAKPYYDPNKQWDGAALSMANKHWDLLQSKVSPSDKSNSAPATGWEKYVAATAGGSAVKAAWSKYVGSGAAGVNGSFGSFVSWYNNNKENVWHGHKKPVDLVQELNAKSGAMAKLTTHETAQSGSGPAQADRSSPMGRGAFDGVTLTPEEKERAINALNKDKGWGPYSNK